MKPAILPYTSQLMNCCPLSLPVNSPLVQNGPVSQPPIRHVQQCHCALVQPLGGCCQHTVNVPMAAQYSVVSCPTTPTSTDIIQASANFPPENTNLVHTHASYSNQPIPELVPNICGNWTLTLNVPVPGDMLYPTLTSFSYTLKYSTAGDRLASVIRTNVRLATTESGAMLEGISMDMNTYRDGINVVPQTSGGAVAACLSSVPGIKDNDLEGQWNHFVDRQQIPLHIRIIRSSRLYLQFHIAEYPAAAMLRSLSVDVSATWVEDQEARRLLQQLQEAQKRADDAEAKLAEILRQGRGAGDAKVEIKPEPKPKPEPEPTPATSKEGGIADDNMQEKIKAALNRLPEGRRCPEGYDWIQVAAGFECKGKGHQISWEELNAA